MKFWHFCRALTLGPMPLGLALLLALLLATSCGQPAITFVHMTDPQIGFRDTTAGFRQSDELMQRAVEATNAVKPNAVFITGDLVNDPDDSLQLAIFARNVAELNAPVRLVPGNHDMLGYGPERRQAYLAQYGYDHFVLKRKGCVFLGIDTNCIKENDTEAEEAQWAWLEEELANARVHSRSARHIFLFLHCPIVREALDEPEDYFNFSPEKRARYLALLKKYGVEAVFAGHTHCGYTATIDGIAFYTASAIGNCLKHGTPGINVVRVSRKGTEVTFVPTS